ncbi:hypothetical protein K8I28_15375 [bacterium]|nr:hypothetical protein [bacterium]
MPSLRKRLLKSGNTFWSIIYYVDGQQRYAPIGQTDRRTAEKIYHRFLGQLADGKFDIQAGIK